MPANRQLIETILLACLEPNPIQFRSADEHDLERLRSAIRRADSPLGASLRSPIKRNSFLCGCLDFTKSLPEEHLIVGYGFRQGKTTMIERLHHVSGRERSVPIPDFVRNEIRRHHFHATDAEVIVFHNHPRTGTEAEWLYIVKAIAEDLPIASSADRTVLQQHAYNAVALLRKVLGQGDVHFYIGESGFVRQFNLPNILPFLDQINSALNNTVPKNT
jgi:hypothetical protein